MSITDKILSYLRKEDVKENTEIISAYTISQLGESILSENSEAYDISKLIIKINRYLKDMYDHRYDEDYQWYCDVADEKRHCCSKIYPYIDYDNQRVELFFAYDHDNPEMIYQNFDQGEESDDIYMDSKKSVLWPAIIMNSGTMIIKQLNELQKYAHYFSNMYPDNPSEEKPMTTKVNDRFFSISWTYNGHGSFHTSLSLLNHPENEKESFLIQKYQDNILRKIPVRVDSLSPTLRLLVEENVFQKENVSVY